MEGLLTDWPGERQTRSCFGEDRSTLIKAILRLKQRRDTTDTIRVKVYPRRLQGVVWGNRGYLILINYGQI